MRCPSCGFENPEGMNFCGRCGTQLSPRCPHCDFENPPGFAFCGKCGASFAEPTPAARPQALTSPLQRLQTSTPAHLAEKILTSRGALEGERTQVTVRFVDISAFTTRAKHLGTLGKPDTVGQSWAMLADRERRWTEHDR
jgi:Double zinc ribbon